MVIPMKLRGFGDRLPLLLILPLLLSLSGTLDLFLHSLTLVLHLQNGANILNICLGIE